MSLNLIPRHFEPPLRNTSVSTSSKIEANSSGKVMKPAAGIHVGGSISGLGNAAQKIFAPPSNRSSLQSIAIAANISPLFLKPSPPPTKVPIFNSSPNDEPKLTSKQIMARKCRVCKQLLKGHKGPSGRGKCKNFLDESFVESESSETFETSKNMKVQSSYKPKLPGSSSSFLDRLDTISDSDVDGIVEIDFEYTTAEIMPGDLYGNVPSSTDRVKVAVVNGSQPSMNNGGLEEIVEGHDSSPCSNRLLKPPNLVDGGQTSGIGIASSSSCNTTPVPSCSAQPSDKNGGESRISDTANKVTKNTNNKRKSSGEEGKKGRRKKKPTTGSAFDYFRPMQKWQNIFAKENLVKTLGPNLKNVTA